MRTRLGQYAARVVLLGAAVFVAGCAGDAESSGTGESTESSDAGSSQDSGEAGDADDFEPPPGPVRFAFDAGRDADHPAVRAYVAWQRAATTSIRNRELSEAVRAGAASSPADTVRQSIETAATSDYTVPRTMIGRLEAVQSTRRAAILGVCLWSPTFDYHVRESGATAAEAKPHWMGIEVRMTRASAHDGPWRVSGLSVEQDCEGKRP